jgi:hypothetical protein
MPRASYHSGTDAARVCQSSLPASLPVKPHHPQNSSKYLKNLPNTYQAGFAQLESCLILRDFQFSTINRMYSPYGTSSGKLAVYGFSAALLLL